MKFSAYPYSRPDIAQLQLEFKDLINQFTGAETPEAQLDLMHKINVLRSGFDTMYQICSIRHSIDTRDVFYAEEQTFFDENSPSFEALSSDYYAALIQAKFRPEIEAKFGKQLFKIAEMQLRAFKPEIIEDLITENKLSTEYQELIASAAIPFDGEEKTLAEMVPYLRSTDRNIRERASNSRWQFFVEHADALDRIFDELVKTRQRIAIKLGFENFIPVGYLRMMRSDYNAEMVANFREQVRAQIVPMAIALKHKQAKRLGLPALKYYDEPLSFKSGNATPKGTPEWIIENGKKMYSELSDETATFFNFMLDNELMDLVAKKGKAGGGYCTYISGFKAPFIFSNFNGTSADIDVLTHEVGHAFQVYMSRGFETAEYYWPTSDGAEIHSMSMEYFAYPWMDNFFNGEADKYRYSHLVDSLLFLPYGVAVDEFQHGIYAHPEWTPDERKTFWSDLEKKYQPYKDYDGNKFLMQGGFWQTQAHIYQSPFYYIDYTLAQICAFQFWLKARQDNKSAFNDYVKLCKAGGSKSFLELVEYAGLQSPFQRETVSEIVDEINRYLSEVDDSRWN
ncbi:MAG: M3 family oligoendopeptidase [Bacteroidetes bacterium]|nr:M3 family oligoendopeptidase [Bacteroidota bacterium]